ncbi:MAG TPA: hypothetical protein VLJ37_08625 [bacterium]|nr:hypothetical protein [bacterium]
MLAKLLAYRDFARMTWVIRKELKCEIEDVDAALAPTLVFPGILFGYDAFVRTGCHKIFWKFLKAVLYYGDRIIENFIHRYGTDVLKGLLDSQKTKDDFFLFPQDMTDRIGVGREHERLAAYYDQIRFDCEHFEALDPSGRERMLQCFVASSYAAIESTIFEDGWRKLDREDPDIAKKLLESVARTEYAKNVRVVMECLRIKELFGGFPVYPVDDHTMVCRTSHWFTLIDDLLDFKEDVTLNVPNHLVAFSHAEGEWKDMERCLNTSSLAVIPPDVLKKTAPRTMERFWFEYKSAKRSFVEAFPLCPRLLAGLIEWRALGARHLSPFLTPAGQTLNAQNAV